MIGHFLFKAAMAFSLRPEKEEEKNEYWVFIITCPMRFPLKNPQSLGLTPSVWVHLSLKKFNCPFRPYGSYNSPDLH